jgi:predicted DNA-binding protein with PD1-like motif
MRYHQFGEGRFVVRLGPGEELVASLVELAKAEDIQAGYVTGIGSTSKVTLGFLDPEAGEYLDRVFDEPMEIAQLTGTFSQHEERPVVHVHGVVAPRELLAYAGHIQSATVGVVAELIVTKLPGRLDRQEVEGQPFLGLLLPGESPPAGDEAAS